MHEYVTINISVWLRPIDRGIYYTDLMFIIHTDTQGYLRGN